MALKWGDVKSVLFTFLILVALPLVAIRFIPAQTIEQLSAAGLDIRNIAKQTALLGLVVSAISLAKAITTSTSIVYLILDISSNLVSLAFAFLLVGIGNIGSLGYSSFKLTQGKVTTEILLDLRIFIWLTIGAVALNVLQSLVRFSEARADEERKKLGEASLKTSNLV
jgi:uncharacterized membrane protein